MIDNEVKEIKRRQKENLNYVKTKKEQQRIEQISKKLPSNYDFYNHLVEQALKPLN